MYELAFRLMSPEGRRNVCFDKQNTVATMLNVLTLNLVVNTATARLSGIIRVPDRVAQKF
jgi:hypothetical protein